MVIFHPLLRKIKWINLDKYSDIGTYLVALWVNDDDDDDDDDDDNKKVLCTGYLKSINL